MLQHVQALNITLAIEENGQNLTENIIRLCLAKQCHGRAELDGINTTSHQCFCTFVFM